MAVNPEMGTDHSLEAAASRIEGLFGEAEEPMPDEVEDQAEEVEEPESDDAEVEAESEEETEAEADEVEAEPEESDDEQQDATFASVAELEEALGQSLDNLTETVKVNGETFEVPRSELKAGYQKDADYRQKTEALKREREAWEAERQARYQALEQEHAQNAYVLNTMEQQLLSEFNSEELAQLRHTNPQEWTARRMEQQEKLAHFERLKQESAFRLNQMREQHAQEQQAQLAKILERERQLLHQNVAGWNDSAKQQAIDYLLADGWGPDDISKITDHRLLKYVWNSIRFEQGQKQAKTTVQKVKKAPKLVKPTKPASPVKVQQSSLRKLKSQLKKSGHINDAARVIEQLI